jgi:ribosomal protein S4
MNGNASLALAWMKRATGTGAFASIYNKHADFHMRVAEERERKKKRGERKKEKRRKKREKERGERLEEKRRKNVRVHQRVWYCN